MTEAPVCAVCELFVLALKCLLRQSLPLGLDFFTKCNRQPSMPSTLVRYMYWDTTAQQGKALNCKDLKVHLKPGNVCQKHLLSYLKFTLWLQRCFGWVTGIFSWIFGLLVVSPTSLACLIDISLLGFLVRLLINGRVQVWTGVSLSNLMKNA